MRKETRVAVETCVAALNTVYTYEERERRSRPPYPLPDRLVWCRDLVFAEVERLRREGEPNCSCVMGTLDWGSQSWETIANQLRHAHGHDTFSEALILLFAASDMSPAEFENVIPHVPSDITRNKLRSQLIHALLGVGEIARAEQISDTLEPFRGRDQRFLGHRRIAYRFARQGDAAAFFGRWPRLDPRQERHHMGELKKTLVESVGGGHGWREAIKVTGDRRLGPAYRINAFADLAEAGEVEQLRELFSTTEASGLLRVTDELAVLSRALVAKATRTGVATHEPFTAILHRIIAIDPSDKQAMRERDGMLLTLWPAYPGLDTLALARKSARTPSIRRELATLHPRIARLDPDRL
ncbi:hypothetical protein OH799_16175 [Nocardia sp. NBC_00881]|uniref:hypothetical protein n=1 Tax=Nocardia sp. NBC_00881 TaxID=2975995 RepID=UPI003863367D|nr:hypothetical protein OH799_16175 [Nocardia sp. NBC_00881]